MGRLKIYMAPLQGLTEAPYRNAFEKHFGGVDVYYTPFIRWEHGGLRRKDVRDLHPDANKVGHLVPQIIAASAEEAELILDQVVSYGYQEVDLNMGCAFPMLVKKGKGCGLLPEPERVRGLLQVVERYPDISFSVKFC
jgi:tRNA-dihydrouridine synthase B